MRLILLIIYLFMSSSRFYSRDSDIQNLLHIDLGKKEGLNAGSSISEEALQKVLRGVRDGNKNSIYYYGLLRLYGISLQKDVQAAATRYFTCS